MSERGDRVRLRQAVLVAAELEPVAGALRARSGSASRSAIPAWREFGLENVVFAIGDCFLEVDLADAAQGRPPGATSSATAATAATW